MSPLRNSIAALSLALACVASAYAQAQPAQAQSERATVTATAAGDRVRFAAPNRVARLKLEVLSAAGDVLVEISSKGSVLDWTPSDAQGNGLADGPYLGVLTLKDLSGRITQRLTLLEVEGGAVTARAATASDLTARQAEAVGPVEAEAASVVGGGEATAATLLAHDGQTGQLVTTTGDLSFRGGDFFTGRDTELMRLSADGSLEVAGALTARGGIRFADGTVLASAAGLAPEGRGGKGQKAVASTVNGDGGGAASPSAIPNRLAKFDGSGNLIDSAVTETGDRVGIGTDAPAQRLEVLGNTRFAAPAGSWALGTAHHLFVSDDGSPVGFQNTAADAGSGAHMYDHTGALRAFFQWHNSAAPNPNSLNFATAGADPITFLTNSTAARVTITGAGDVGIGTRTPAQALHVVGKGLFQTAGTAALFIVDRVDGKIASLGAGGTSSTFAYDNTGIFKIESNSRAQIAQGVFGTGATTRFTIDTSGNVGVGTATPTAKLDVAGSLKVSGDAVVDGNIAAKYQDVAEWVPGRGSLPAGTVVVLDRSRTNGVVPSSRAYSTHVAGVVSAQPGVILGEGGPGQVMVATTGRVKVKVDATRLPVRVGDLLVASDIEGVAMRSVPARAGRARLHRPGTIIGKALEPLASGRGEILVLLSMQ